MQQMLVDIRAVALDEGRDELFNDPARILPLHFVQTLENTIRYFVEGSRVVNSQRGEVTNVLACLLEGEVSSNNGEIEVFQNGRIYVEKRSQAHHDALLRKVQELLRTTYGKVTFSTWREDDERFFEPRPPAGDDSWAQQRAHAALAQLSAVSLGPRDADAKDKLLTKDGTSCFSYRGLRLQEPTPKEHPLKTYGNQQEPCKQ